MEVEDYPGTPTVDAARIFGDELKSRGEEIEETRRLPADVVEGLIDLGVFRMWIPRRFRGAELNLQPGLAVLEELAFWDGSTGWCAMIGALTALMAGFLPESFAHQIYGAEPRGVTGGTVAPMGRARRAEGGLMVSGRWPWGSGTQHCQWIGGGCRVAEEGSERPRAVVVFFEAKDVRFHDTWHASGLRGTGSLDFEVEEAFVPQGRWVELGVDLPRVPGALYRFPLFGVLALGVAVVAQGIARRSVAEFKELAAQKSYVGSRRTLAQRPVVQQQVAEAEVALQASRALMEKAIATAWQAARQGALTVEHRAGLRQSATFTTDQARRAVDLMYHAAGGTAVYRSSVLQRTFRDVHVATQHAMVAPRNYELLGRLSLGLETDVSQL